MNTFKSLGLSGNILKAITEMGFEEPSEIQVQSIPELLQFNRDFIGLAQTGTGKTAAFGLPLIQKINPKNNYTQALILAPTRELGQQIAEQLTLYGKYQPSLNILAVYGGASIGTQMRALKRPQHIIIATPGRLIDLINRKAIKLNQLQCLVLDEADEMLNMGFKEDIDQILSYTPAEKITWLFSATMPSEIRRIVKTYMKDPLEAKINAKGKVNANIQHQYTVVKRSDKADALMRFLDINPQMRGVVFCRTKRDTQELAEFLLAKNYKADALHGDLSQSQRDVVMQRFKKHALQVLVATDVAARGIDVNDLTHVFHFTLPDDTSYYTHRSGRTARAGKEGISIAFINGREKNKIDRIAQQLGIVIQRVKIPDVSDIADERIENWCLELLETKTKGVVNPESFEKAKVLLANLSKEELLGKFLAQKMSMLGLTKDADLNESIDKRGSKSSSSRFDNKKRGGSGRKRKWSKGGGGGGDFRKKRKSKSFDKKRNK